MCTCNTATKFFIHTLCGHGCTLQPSERCVLYKIGVKLHSQLSPNFVHDPSNPTTGLM